MIIKKWIYYVGTVLCRIDYVPQYVITETSVPTLQRSLDKANDGLLALHSLRRENAQLRDKVSKLSIENSILKLRQRRLW